MAYTPKVWQCGDDITAEELNRMEEGIESANSGGGGTPLIVNGTLDGTGEVLESLDKTWQEIHDAFPNVIVKCEIQRSTDDETFVDSTTIVPVTTVVMTPDLPEYSVTIGDANLTTNTPNGYPRQEIG